MKKTIMACLVILATILTVAAQSKGVVKFRTTTFAYKFLEEDGWEEWSDWYSENALIVFDSTKQRVKIFSQEKQIYDIIHREEIVEGDNDVAFLWDCINEDGDECSLKLCKRYRDDGSSYLQLYIYFSYWKNVFNMYPID